MGTPLWTEANMTSIEPEAGPSTEPVDAPASLFKKRAGRPRPQARLASADASSEDVADAAQGASLEELIALRKLRTTKGGIDLHRLNEGEKKKRRKKDDTEASKQNNGFQEDDEEDGDSRTKKILRADNFTGQSNSIDVDKHMMEYIETELKARRAQAGEAAEPAEQQEGPIDPREELYKVSDRYRIDRTPVAEGNVTLSAAMLTAVPEVDLGIENRLKNIEATEKAKRKLAEQEALAQDEDVKEHFAADRFLLPNKQWSTDAEALKIAKLESEGLMGEADALRRAVKKAQQSKFPVKAPSLPGVAKQQLATDTRAVENFRKRAAERR